MDKTKQNREVAIRLQGVKKRYRLGQIGGGTLTADLQSWWARLRGKEDPNTKIGVDQRLLGTTFMALNGIDLTIYKGEAVGIIGGNGAGKSTMLKLLSRVTGPTEGDIDIYGRITSMLEVGTGFNGEMTGRENVYMNGAILGMTKAEIDAKMEEIIEFSEVRDFIDTPVKRYSSGMYVKLAFSVAAHLDSEIMIMDEVLAVGDVAFQQKCLTKMRDAATLEGRTVLYVSHNMGTIRQLCDRCIVLNQGQVVFEGDVESAIEVYMKKDNQAETQIDYTDFKRASYLKDDARIISAEYVDKKDIVFGRDETLKFRLKWMNYKDIDDMGFRVTVLNTNDIRVGTGFEYHFYKGKSKECVSAIVEMDLGKLAPGRYHAYYALYQVNKFGAVTDVDGVYGLDFVIEEKSTGKMPWRPQWGNFELSTPKITIEKTEV